MSRVYTIKPKHPDQYAEDEVFHAELNLLCVKNNKELNYEWYDDVKHGSLR